MKLELYMNNGQIIHIKNDQVKTLPKYAQLTADAMRANKRFLLAELANDSGETILINLNAISTMREIK